MRESRAIDLSARVATDLLTVKPTNNEEEKELEEYQRTPANFDFYGHTAGGAAEIRHTTTNQASSHVFCGPAHDFCGHTAGGAAEIRHTTTNQASPSDLSADKPTNQPSNLSDSVFNDAENNSDAPVAAELGLGFDEGLAVGELVGFDEGLSVGESMGFELGIPVGELLGFDEGLAVGECDKYTRGVVRRGRISSRVLAEEATEATAGVDADWARMDGFDQGIAV
jgi:hypothetical protein